MSICTCSPSELSMLLTNISFFSKFKLKNSILLNFICRYSFRLMLNRTRIRTAIKDQNLRESPGPVVDTELSRRAEQQQVNTVLLLCRQPLVIGESPGPGGAQGDSGRAGGDSTGLWGISRQRTLVRTAVTWRHSDQEDTEVSEGSVV